MKHFEEVVVNGDLDEADYYLSGFTTLQQNAYSKKAFFEIRKLKYLEALDKREREKAVKILRDELKAFENDNASLYRNLAAPYIYKQGARAAKQVPRRKNGKSCHFCDCKEANRVQPRVSLNWQHLMCQNQTENPFIETLYEDHICPLQTENASLSVDVPNPPLSLTPVGDPSLAHGQNVMLRPEEATRRPTTQAGRSSGAPSRSMDNAPKREEALSEGRKRKAASI